MNIFSNNLEIYNETKWQINNLPFLPLKNKILGEEFQLSVSFLLSKNSKKINLKMRNKKYIPNTLSFKYAKHSGEIILTPEIIENENYSALDSFKLPKINSLFQKNNEKKARKMQKFSDKIVYLFIHSCLHLKDLDHGPKMEQLERKFFQATVV